MARDARRTRSRLSARARPETAKRTNVRIRQHAVTVDDATDRGGSDLGPNPPETLLSALAGCLNIQLHRLAKERSIKFRNIRFSIDADFDRRGVTWGDDVAVPFPVIRIDLQGRSDGSHSAIAKLRRDVLRRCPVSRVLLEGGTRFRQNWTVDPL